MAVYTDVPPDALRAFLAEYELGEPVELAGIAEGVENSNFRLQTERGRYILTVYEKRVDPADLPFFLGLIEHLARHGLPCPLPVHARDGQALRQLMGKPAAIVSCLEGRWPRRIAVAHCAALGEALAALHLAAADFTITRANALSFAGWQSLFEGCRGKADAVEPGLEAEIAGDLEDLARMWPRDLPAGVIHADLFPDNVFFAGERVTGIIDFYFACNDLLAYDVAICLNAWCFETDGSFNLTKAQALLQGYRRRRALSPAEVAALPVLARGSALRFLMTRLYDWLHQVEGAKVTPKDPREYLTEAALPSRRRRPAGLRPVMSALPAADDEPVLIHTDGACSGNPGPGGWGAILAWKGKRRELSGGERLTTNNRMELMAAIAALETLKRPSRVSLFTDSQYLRKGITEWIDAWRKRGWRTADKQPVKNQDLWERLDAVRRTHEVDWHWLKGHAGHADNERCDELARDEIRRLRER